MAADHDVSTFIRTTFRSVWSLELLLLLRAHANRGWSPPEMVAALRASELVVKQGVEGLLAAGLIVVDDSGAARYQPVSAELDGLVAAVEALYAKSPDAVRRAIIAPSPGGLSAFANAFRLRKD